MNSPDPKPAAGETRRECQAVDYGPYSYGAQYPCHLTKGHDGPHECMDKDDCPHTWKNRAAPSPASSPRKDAPQRQSSLAEMCPEQTSLGTFGQMGKCKYQQLPHTEADHEAMCNPEAAWTAEKPEGERLGTCSPLTKPHMKQNCLDHPNWQPIAYEAAGGEAGIPGSKPMYWCCKADFGQHETTCKNFKAPAAPSGEQTPNAWQFWCQWQADNNVRHHTIDDWPIRFAEAWAEVRLSTLRRERDQREKLSSLGHNMCTVCWSVSWVPVPQFECSLTHPHIGEHVRCDLCRAEAQLRERTAERDQLKDTHRDMVQHVRELRSTIERLEGECLVSSDRISCYGLPYKGDEALQTANIYAWYDTATYWKTEYSKLERQLAELRSGKI